MQKLVGETHVITIIITETLCASVLLWVLPEDESEKRVPVQKVYLGTEDGKNQERDTGKEKQ